MIITLFLLFALFSATSGRIILPFALGKDIRPLLAPSVGAVALILFELDFEVVADADDVGS